MNMTQIQKLMTIILITNLHLTDTSVNTWMIQVGARYEIYAKYVPPYFYVSEEELTMNMVRGESEIIEMEHLVKRSGDKYSSS